MPTELPHHQLLCGNRMKPPHHFHKLRPHIKILHYHRKYIWWASYRNPLRRWRYLSPNPHPRDSPDHQTLCERNQVCPRPLQQSDTRHLGNQQNVYVLSSCLYYTNWKKVCQVKNTQKKIIFEGTWKLVRYRGEGNWVFVITLREPIALIDWMSYARFNAPSVTGEKRECQST